MGLEQDLDFGVHPEDVINVLKGHIKDGYKFQSRCPCSDDNPDFIKKPTLNDKVHCLLSIIPADKVKLMGDNDFKKMREIRKKASDINIPQLALLTKVDQACPEIKKDIKLVYRSKKIKEKMEICSKQLGVTMDSIYPVKCYNEEIDLNPDVNVILLSAMKRILDAANDFVEDATTTTGTSN